MLKPHHIQQQISHENNLSDLMERNARLIVAFQQLIVHVHKFDPGHTACNSYVHCKHDLCLRITRLIKHNEDAGTINRYEDRYRMKGA